MTKAELEAAGYSFVILSKSFYHIVVRFRDKGTNARTFTFTGKDRGATLRKAVVKANVDFVKRRLR